MENFFLMFTQQMPEMWEKRTENFGFKKKLASDRNIVFPIFLASRKSTRKRIETLPDQMTQTFPKNKNKKETSKNNTQDPSYYYHHMNIENLLVWCVLLKLCLITLSHKYLENIISNKVSKIVDLIFRPFPFYYLQYFLRGEGLWSFLVAFRMYKTFKLQAKLQSTKLVCWFHFHHKFQYLCDPQSKS